MYHGFVNKHIVKQCQKTVSKSSLPALCIFVLFTFVDARELDLILMSQNSFYSSSVKSLGGAGIALPSDLTNGLLNPALVYSYFQSDKTIKCALTAGYGRDSLFEKSILPIGIGYCGKDGAIAGFYRFLQGDNSNIQNEFTLNMSGVLFGPAVNEDEQVEAGQVDFGINVHYELYTWKKRTLQLSDTSDIFSNAKLKQKRLIFDLGLYQSNIAPNLDFAVTFRNLFGYLWTEENPSIKDSLQTIYSPNGDSIVNTVPYYSLSAAKTKGWLEREYKIITTGIAYHIILNGGTNQIILPLDLEMLGLFDKHIKNQYIFRGGVSVNLQKRFIINFGYARTPGPIRSGWQEIKKVNVFSGGGGINVGPIALSFYISGDAFGTDVECKF